MTDRNAMNQVDGTHTALGHIRVIDLAGPMGQRCGKLMADMGADVIKVEPLEGDFARTVGPFYDDKPHREGSLYFLNFNANKKSVILDLDSKKDQMLLRRLVSTADVLIESFMPGYLEARGLGFKNLKRINPGLVMTSITTFGQNGPYSHFHGSDLVAQAMGGLMYVQGDDMRAPCAAPCELAYQLGSVHAAYGTLAALHTRRISGIGQHIDLSLYEVIAHLLFIVARYAFNGDIMRRAGRLINNAPPPSSYYQCKDGQLVSISVIFPPDWKALVDWMGNEILADPLWDDHAFKYANQDIIVEITQEFIGQFSRSEFVEEAQRRHISAIPINTLKDVVESPKNEARSYFVKSDHPYIKEHVVPGTPYRFSATPWEIYRSAPLLGEHQNEVLSEALYVVPKERVSADSTARQYNDIGTLPLKNVRIVDFTRVWAGALGIRYLADLGAEVIKVETARFPDGIRNGIPIQPSVPDLNRSKLSITVDFHKREGMELLKRLVEVSDIVVDNFPSGVLERRGLGYEVLKKIKPDIIMVSMPGFGNSGPYAKYVAYGQELMAASGLTYLWGYPDSPQVNRAKAYYTDFSSAGSIASAIMMALECRNHTGLGQYIELDQSESATCEMGVGLLDYMINKNDWAPQGNSSYVAGPHGSYPCRGDDQWCVIDCVTQEHWDALCQVAEGLWWTKDSRFTSLESRRRHYDELDKAIGEWTKTYTPYQLMRMLQRAGVPAGAVQSGEQIYHDYHLRDRNYILEIDHAQPWGKMEHTGVPMIFSRTPGRVNGLKALGENNDYIFYDLLGLNKGEVAILSRNGVLS